MNVSGKKFTILGLGKSGRATALFLARKGAEVLVSENKTDPETIEVSELLKKEGVHVELGKHSVSSIGKADYIVVSPGISPHSDLMKSLRKFESKWISDIDVASWFCRGKIIAITGTNGKTSVVTLVANLIEGTGLMPIKCGNIGTPFAEVVDKIDLDAYAVVELSSFQLYYSKFFKPHIAVLLNLAPDHLDWHLDFDEYAASKLKIFSNQEKEDYAVVNYGDPEVMNRLPELKSEMVYFNREEYFLNQNFDCLFKISKILMIDEKIFKTTHKSFEGIEHRLEFVREKNGISYINDSKSTSLHSLEWALNSFSEKVVLILGGRNKGLQFETIQHLIKEKAKFLIAIGEASDAINKALADHAPIYLANDLRDAVQKAEEVSQKGDTVLFSPACASFDMFHSYEDRGRQFKKIVRE